MLVKADTSENIQLDFFDLLDEAPVEKVAIVAGGECCATPILIEESGCVTCKSCGWSKCHIA